MQDETSENVLHFQLIVLCLDYPSSVFHILDSLSTSNSALSEVEQLQRIFLKYFDKESFKKGRIAVNVAQVLTPSFILLQHLLNHPDPIMQVPTQPNSYDCGCYTIFFARNFIARPDAILKLIKVLSFIFPMQTSTKHQD